jgi:hypothetical protein
MLTRIGQRLGRTEAGRVSIGQQFEVAPLHQINYKTAPAGHPLVYAISSNGSTTEPGHSAYMISTWYAGDDVVRLKTHQIFPSSLRTNLVRYLRFIIRLLFDIPI